MWVLGQFLLFALVLASPYFLSDLGVWHGIGHTVAGVAFIVLGLMLLTAGSLNLGADLTPMPQPREKGELHTTGIYGVVRHPIYSGLTLAILGYCLILPSILEVVIAGVVAYFFDRKASREEARLLARFEGYAEYRRRTSKLIPWLY